MPSSAKSSDIHFEPEANFLRIRYRIDGMLRQIRALHKSYWPAMTVRIKVLSGMNIAETRAPQDGRIGAHRMRGRQVDFRVACQPTIHGENIVLRILDRQKGIVPLEDLGLAEEHLHQLKLMIARPEGIILVTGPTGSGKTTTLYSVLNHINSEGINIMTLEDPVEYPMALVRQTSVAETAKLDFANGIRSMMRQDPDVILVGEIRDADTAEMALRAAMTGHQVYSTLHTNSAIGAIPRLLDIGILPDIMAGNIIGIVAQRLIRRLCDHCKSPYQAEAHEMHLLGTPADGAAPGALPRHAAASAATSRAIAAASRSWNCCASTCGIDELIARRATTHEIRTRRAQPGLRHAGRRRPAPRSRRHDLARGTRARRRPDRPDVADALRLQGGQHRRAHGLRTHRRDQHRRPRDAPAAHGTRPGHRRTRSATEAVRQQAKFRAAS